MEILSVIMTLMGVFSCLIYISPFSHPHITRFQPHFRKEDVNEVKTGVFRLKGQQFPRPLSSRLVGFTLDFESIHSCSFWANNTTKALANFQQKNTERLPNVPLYHRLYLMGLCRLKCHTLPRTPFAQYLMFPC